MTTPDTTGTSATGPATAREGWFLRAAARVGDLGSPFYREERQRDVWNEASAVGFQLLLVVMLAAATAMVWIGGEQALPYALTVTVLTGAASGVVIRYAEVHGVLATGSARLLAPRMVPFLVLVALLVVGVVRAVPAGSATSSTWWGAAAGAGLVGALALVAHLRSRRRDRD